MTLKATPSEDNFMISFTCEWQQLCNELLLISIATEMDGTKQKVEIEYELFKVVFKSGFNHNYPYKALSRRCVRVSVRVEQPS